MKGVRCYELFGGIALINHAFSFRFIQNFIYVYLMVIDPFPHYRNFKKYNKNYFMCLKNVKKIFFGEGKPIWP